MSAPLCTVRSSEAARLYCDEEDGVASPMDLDLARVIGKHNSASTPTVSILRGDMDLPSVIGPYRIVSTLAKGGMGVVYRARHIASERTVALKTVRVPSPRWLGSIRREIHALTQIKHPGVVRIVDHGVDQGRPWYAMDLLEGPTLRQFSDRIWSRYKGPSGPAVGPTDQVSATAGNSERSPARDEDEALSSREWRTLADGPVPAAAGELRTVLNITRRICATLAFLHGEGFVNCDVKPENIVLLQGEPVVIDFGLTAQHPGRSGREALESQYGAAGTPPYMSPEQIRGDLVDARSDLYALGCMLYELVTGAAPFTGSPPSIRTGHLFQDPKPPSELVAGLPSDLEAVILRLLDKDLTARFGYADEVATLLARMMGDDLARLPGFPPSRSYLYRPRLVGRDEIMAQLVSLRERAADGSGSLVLLAGESGAGKTRVAMELTRLLDHARMVSVTSEASLLGPDGNVAPPLHIVRPVMQAVADRCHEGGVEATERMLGPRSSVLAAFEPLLSQVPAKEPLSPPLPLPVDASRRRLFTYLADTLAAFAGEQPVIWVVDDLGWADDLSLSFLQFLPAQYFASTPLLIVCAYRSEEATEPIKALANLPHVSSLTVSRLGQTDVSTMVADMLALTKPDSAFVAFVTQQAEGNPFFVTEYLRGAVNERLLFRDSRHQWQIGDPGVGRITQYPSLPLPGSLRELIEQRLLRLSPGAQHASSAGAVLGREFEIDVLREVAGLSEEGALAAIDELLRKQVFEHTSSGRVRFAHDKLREVEYSRNESERRVQLHAKAGHALERRLADVSAPHEQWPVLGYHFAEARLPQFAAPYFKLAADRARATYANADAIRLYRETLRQISLASLSRRNEDSWASALSECNEGLGDALALAGQRDEARSAYADALSHSDNKVVRARLHRKIGKCFETEDSHQAALARYHDAQVTLGSPPLELDVSSRDEWIQIQGDRVWAYYWLNHVSNMRRAIEELRPIVELYGSASQRSRFSQALLQLDLRERRYVIADSTLHLSRMALSAANAADRPMARFLYGFTLLLHFSLDGAETELQEALAFARRDGDVAQQARVLAYLTVVARMRRDFNQTATRANAALEVAAKAGVREYVASAEASLAWISLRRHGDPTSALTHARPARAIWRAHTGVYPFQWLGLLPQIEACLSVGRLEEAIECTHDVLSPTQHCLPEPTQEAFRLAQRHWADGHVEKARACLDAALSAFVETCWW